MSLLKSIIEAQGGKILQQVAGNFGLDASQATKAIGSLLPALTQKMKQNTQSDNGLEGLLGALKKGNHSRYLDDPSLFGQGGNLPEATVNEGNGILGHILGSKAASRQVAAEASQKTGIDASILKKLLPMVATMAMGGMSKQAQSRDSGLGGLLGGLLSGGVSQQRQSSGIDGILGKILDADNDGSVLDDVMGMAKKFF
ncbi:MAG: DUF937 domain-containing protein [Gammaproteobacteria bacterium]